MTTYREYYAACRADYPDSAQAVGLYGLRVYSQGPGAIDDGALFMLPRGYLAMIGALAAEVERRIEAGVGIYRNRDAQVAALAIQLDAIWDLEALEGLAEVFVPQAERKILGCLGLVNQVTVIRSLATTTPSASSWLWHYDNKPDGAFKILVYLTDVDADSGAFEYLRRPDTLDVVSISSSRFAHDRVTSPRWPQSRVPADAIANYRAMGYEPHRVVGPRGTLIAFDNNCIHRATIPCRRHRDAVIFNVRPCHKVVRPFISQRHTGSWSFNAKQWIPEILEISVRP